MSEVATATSRTVAILEKLVAFDTVSRKSNLAFIDFVRGMLGEHGIESRLVFNEERTKANLLATIGPHAAGGIVLTTADFYKFDHAALERPDLLGARRPRVINQAKLGDALTAAEPPVRAIIVTASLNGTLIQEEFTNEDGAMVASQITVRAAAK